MSFIGKKAPMKRQFIYYPQTVAVVSYPYQRSNVAHKQRLQTARNSKYFANSFQIIRRCKTKTNCDLQWGLPTLNKVYWNVFVLKSHRFHAILTFVRLVLVIHLKFFTIVQRTDYVKFKLYFPLLGKHHLQSTYYFWQFAVFVCARHCCADTGS